MYDLACPPASSGANGMPLRFVVVCHQFGIAGLEVVVLVRDSVACVASDPVTRGTRKQCFRVTVCNQFMYYTQ